MVFRAEVATNETAETQAYQVVAAANSALELAAEVVHTITSPSLPRARPTKAYSG